MKTLCMPEDEAEAASIRAMLEANLIYPSIQSFYDTAYDGVFQGQHGWGIIKVADDDYEKAIALLTSWQAGSPVATEMLADAESRPIEEAIAQQYAGLSGHKCLLLSTLLSLSILLNVIFGVRYFLSKGQKRTDYDQYDTNHFLMGRIEWGKNKNGPYKQTTFLRNGAIAFISLDNDDDRRTDEFIRYWPNAEATAFDNDGNGIFESSTILFDSGSRIEYRDHDQNGIMERATIKLANGRIYQLRLSNQNELVLMITTSSGDPVSLDILKQIALEI